MVTLTKQRKVNRKVYNNISDDNWFISSIRLIYSIFVTTLRMLVGKYKSYSIKLEDNFVGKNSEYKKQDRTGEHFRSDVLVKKY